MNRRFAGRLVAFLLLPAALLLVLVLGAGVGSASTSNPYVVCSPSTCGGGGTAGCWATGTTYNGNDQQVYTPVCPSYQTAFYVYVSNYGTLCSAAGYIAKVYTENYTLRFTGNWCADGTWHLSTAWGSDERRFSWMQIQPAHASYQMIQYG